MNKTPKISKATVNYYFGPGRIVIEGADTDDIKDFINPVCLALHSESILLYWDLFNLKVVCFHCLNQSQYINKLLTKIKKQSERVIP